MDMLSSIGTAFSHGGFWMWPILALQLASLGIAIERVIALFVKRKVTQLQIATQYEDSIRRGELKPLMEKMMSSSDPIARVTMAGSKAAAHLGGKDEIQGKMDEVLAHENMIIEKRTGFLSMLGNVATLTGLLGTITGMIKSFAAVSFANPAEKATLLAAGVSEAMNATAYGLITAIPALVMYAILTNRAHHLAEDLNQAALKVFNWLSYSYEPVGFATIRSAGKNNQKEIDV